MNENVFQEVINVSIQRLQLLSTKGLASSMPKDSRPGGYCRSVGKSSEMRCQNWTQGEKEDVLVEGKNNETYD